VLTLELLTENVKIYVNLRPKYHGEKEITKSGSYPPVEFPLKPSITGYIRTFQSMGLPNGSLTGVYLLLSFEPVD
jgi:hypothetical protein